MKKAPIAMYVAPSTKHPGYSWVAFVGGGKCGCAEVMMKPVADRALDDISRTRGGAPELRLDFDPTDTPFFTPAAEYREWLRAKLTGEIE